MITVRVIVTVTYEVYSDVKPCGFTSKPFGNLAVPPQRPD